MKLRVLASAACLAFGTLAANASITITTNNDAQFLGNSLLGAGISASNFSATGNAAQFGTFTGGNTLGNGFFDNGIILSSGNVATATGPNTAGNTSMNFGGAGNADLDNLVSSNTNDAATLTFDFETTGGDIFFNYFFASEEYNEFVGSEFNDVFGFFVNGQNIATLPGGDPVAINTVNNGSNSGLFNDNSGGVFDIEFDGFTNVLTASALGLGAGTHTISISVADTSDFILDSAVFLQVGSFSDTVTPIPEPATWLMMILGFAVTGLSLKRRNSLMAAK